MTTVKPPLAAIPFKLLLSYYLIAPLALAIMLGDQLFLGGAWQRLIPTTPYVFFLYAVFFNLPHIVCSSVMLLNKEYITHYRKGLLWVLAVAVALPVLAGFFLSNPNYSTFNVYMVSIGIFAAITLYHVFMQQLGINKMFARSGHWAFNAIAWSNILPGTGAYILMFIASYAQAAQYYPAIHHYSVLAGFVCIGISSVFYVICWRCSQTRAGRLYLVANGLAALAGLCAIYFEYWLFALVVPRVIHDLTAFTIYINHDTNRYRQLGRKAHPLYGPLWRLGVPAFILTPLVAIAIALPISKGYINIGWAAFYILALIHYGTESFVWKHGSLHRRYISFTGVK